MTSKALVGELRKCVVSVERLDVSKFLGVGDQKENDILAEDNDSDFGSDSSFEELGIDNALQIIQSSLPPEPSDFSTEKRNEKRKNLSSFNSLQHKKATNTVSGVSKRDSKKNTSKDVHISRKDNREHLSNLKKADQAESAVAKQIMHDHAQNSNTKSMKKNSGKESQKSHVTVKEKHTYKYFDYDFDTDDTGSESDASNYEMNLVASRAARQNILCSKCKEYFSNIHNLFKHTCDGKAEEGFLCQFCGKMFKEQEKFIAHRSSHISKYFRCKFCRIKFKYRKSYTYHMKTFHPECLLFPCMFYKCEKSFSKQFELKRHFITHKKFVCFVCFERFRTHRMLYEHVDSYHK